MTDVRLTQTVVEALAEPAPDVRSTQVVAEVLADAAADVRLTQVVLEVLASVAEAAPPSARRRPLYVVQ